MELQQKLTKDNTLELADRKSLLQLLAFFDGQLPQHCAFHMFVLTTLISGPLSAYQIYFRRKPETEDYSLIVGVQVTELEGSQQQLTRKLWNFITWTPDEEEIPKVFSTFDDIDWVNDGFSIYFQTPTPHPAIASYLKNKLGSDRGTIPYCSTNRFIFTPKNAFNLQISCPDNVYVKSLERCHAQQIFDNWVHNYCTTVENVALGIDQLPSAGVFLKENDELVSWMMCNPPYGMGRLYTMENHRRRGYAKLVAYYLSKRMAQSGFVPFIHIFVVNDVSHKFFKSIGFELECVCHDYDIPGTFHFD